MNSPVLSVVGFQGPLGKIGSVACILLLLQFLWAPLEARPVAGRSQTQRLKTAAPVKVQPLTRPFSVTANGREAIDLAVPGPGLIEVRAEWTGSALKLALILNGPGKTQYYARQDGASPLALSFEITADLLAKGSAWKLSVANFQPDSSAQGTVKITLPKAPSGGAPAGAAATTATVPQAQTSGSSRTAQQAQKKPAERVTKTPQAQVAWTAEQLREIAGISSRIQTAIPAIVQRSKVSAILIPLFYQSLEDMAGRPGLLREYFNSSQHKKGQSEADFALVFKKAVKAYQDVPREFKSRHLHPSYAALTNAQSVDYRVMADEILRAYKPSLAGDLKGAFRSALTSTWLASLSGPALAPGAISRRSARTAETAKRTGVARAVSQSDLRKVGGAVRAGASGPTTAQQSELKSVLEAQGFPLPAKATANPVFQAFGKKTPLRNELQLLNGKSTVTDYYRYKITLDWFHCTNKNEMTDDEPYFSIITAYPQFDPADPSFFDRVADGCLNRTEGFTTRTYEDVERGDDRGLKGKDRVILEALTYNTAASFTIDLWEEDFSKGSVADGIRRAAEDLAKNMVAKISQAVQQRIIEIFMETAIETLESLGGTSTAVIFQLVDQLLGTDLSLADFQKIVSDLLKGRAIDPTWYLLYFLFSGCDWVETLAMIGGGSTVVGWVLLALAVVGPTLGSLIDNLGDLDFEGALLDLFKIVTVLPLIIDFLKTIILEIWNLIKYFLAAVDPDDHIGTKTVVLGMPTSDWHNDANDGEWMPAKLMGAVPLADALPSFMRKGYGPTPDNSSLVYDGKFWVPGFTFQTQAFAYGPDLKLHPTVGTEYDVYYEARREVAAGRATYGYYLPDPAFSSRTISYTAKPGGRGNVIRVSIMSLNAAELPFVYLWENGTGKAMGNFAGEPFFELEAAPGSAYTLYITKLCEGEVGGYVTLAEGPVIKKDRDVSCPELTGGQVAGGGLGSGRYPKKLK
jgi:hypothetical protein